MVAKNRRPIACGEVRVQFVARKDLERTQIIEKNTPRGRMRVASPEATALELVGYEDQCGGLDNVASVIAELVEAIDVAKLVAAARLCPIAWVQRLGYLLDVTEHGQVAEPLVQYVRDHAVAVAPLVRKKQIVRADRIERWKLAVIANVAPDL